MFTRKPKNSANTSNRLNIDFKRKFLERPTSVSGVDTVPANPAAREAPKRNWYHRISAAIDEVSHKPMSL